MKYLALAGFLFFAQISVFGQSAVPGQSPERVNRAIHNFNVRVDSAYKAGDRFSILEASSAIAKEACRYLKRTLPKLQGSLGFDYESSSAIRVATSQDRKFRLWTFDESEGSAGTFETLLEYATTRGAMVLDISDRTPRSAGNGGWCDTIYSVTSSTGVAYYLPIMHYAADGRSAGTGVDAYAIDGERLVRNVKLFKAPKKDLSTISYYYDFFKADSLSEIRLIDNKLLIPLVVKDSVTSGSLRYEFDGKQFVYKGIDK